MCERLLKISLYIFPKTNMDKKDYTEKLHKIATRLRKIHKISNTIYWNGMEELDLEKIFSSKKEDRYILELGSGWGEFASEWIRKYPKDKYLAMEIKNDRIAKSIKVVYEKNPEAKFKVLPINFNWFLEKTLPKQSFDIIIINFPDPWPKRRHWKHRLIQKDFPHRIQTLLRPSGKIYLSTDYSPYARKILGIFQKAKGFKSLYPRPYYTREHSKLFPYTYFEKLQKEKLKRAPYYFSWEWKK